MSYILDALKKADQKRKLGSVPDVHTVHEPLQVPIVKQLHWPYVLAVVLLVNATIIGWWLKPGGERQPVPQVVNKEVASVESAKNKQKNSESVTGQTRTAVAQKSIMDDSTPVVQKRVAGQPVLPREQPVPPPHKRVAAPNATSEPPVPNKRPARNVPRVAAGARAPLQKAVGDEEVIVEESLGIEQEEALPNINVNRSAAMRKMPEQVTAPSKPKAQKPRIVGPAASGSAVADQGFSDEDVSREMKTESEKDKEKRELARIPYLYQLPDAVQRIIPEVRISFHSYSKRPSSRLVSVNGKVVREGQEIAGGIKLEKITSSGVILKYQSRRFKIDV